MTDYRTPTAKVRGLGSSGHGTGHWISQRISAIALFFLTPVFVWMLVQSGAPDPDATRAFLASPAGAIISLLTMSAAFHHMKLGLQVVIEDYIHTTGNKALLLIANSLVTLGLWIAAAFAIAKIAL